MEKQRYNKGYVDNRRNVKESEIRIEDYVLVRLDKQNKLIANFNNVSNVVTHRSHSLVKAKSKNGHVIARNVSQFKRMPKSKDDTDGKDDSDCEGHQ